MGLFGSRTEGLDLKITKVELELEALKKQFRSLETEWTDVLSRYDALVKRMNRAAKLDGKAQGEAPAMQYEQPLTPELIELMFRQGQRG